MDFISYSRAYARQVAEACIGCGECARVCPVLPAATQAEAPAKRLVQGLIDLANGGTEDGPALDWIRQCNSSGLCNDVCPESLNIRAWITSLRTEADVRAIPEKDRRRVAGAKFRAISQAVRLLASMQIPAELIDRIYDSKKRRDVEVIFYTGCNVLRTPHIIMNVMGILDAIDVDYDIIGGAAHCCGVTQHRSGDVASYERVAGRTSAAFSATQTKDIIAWCPTCLIQFNETWETFEKPDYAVSHITTFLAGRKSAIAQRAVAKHKRRIVIQEHGGIPGVAESVRALLESLPFVEVLTVPQNKSFGYVCGGMDPKHDQRQKDNYQLLLDGAADAGADQVVTVYHSCQRVLAGAAVHYPFEVVNFTDIVAEGLGLEPYADIYGEMAKTETLDSVVASVKVFLEENGVQMTFEQIQAIADQMFGEPGFFGEKDKFVSSLATGLDATS